MIFRKNNKLDFSKKYFVNDIECEPLYYDRENEILMLKEDDGNLSFVLSDFKIKDNKIICSNKVSYTVDEKEMLNCITDYLAKLDEIVTDTVIIKAIQSKYHKIPTTIAEVIAYWYMM